MHNDFHSLRNKAFTTMARVALLQGQWLQRELRKDRRSERKKKDWHRLAKEFRALKSLLRAEERRLLEPRRRSVARLRHDAP